MSNCSKCTLLDENGICSEDEPQSNRSDCLAYIEKKNSKTCSRCGRDSTDWDNVGKRGKKEIVCRNCLCPDYEPEYHPVGQSALAGAERDNPFDFNIKKMNEHLAKRHVMMGMPKLAFKEAIQ